MVAGIYQLSPLKNICLKHCRSPADYLYRHWRSGRLGAARMGLEHGLYCVGCCWSLMALLFVGGVMNLMWIAGLALFVLIEKLAQNGYWFDRASGLLMITAGGYLLLA
jgi:predicted metal-binding membrane protein